MIAGWRRAGAPRPRRSAVIWRGMRGRPTAPGGAMQTFSYAWNNGDFFGIAADGSQIYAAGESYPGDGLTTDGVGGTETKSIFVRFDAGWRTRNALLFQ